jgi:peptidoglycan-associated lipoprotein
MTSRSLSTALFGLVLLTTACSKKAEPVTQPTPVRPTPTANSDADDRRRADSLRALEAARLEAERKAAAAAEAARAVLVNELAETIHFDYDQYAISAEDQAKLERKAAILRANPALRIRVTGHADERGSDEYNLALGMRRATAAKSYLTGRGIDAARIEVASLGREVPLDAGSNESAWARNRRDEFEIIAGGQSLVRPN